MGLDRNRSKLPLRIVAGALFIVLVAGWGAVGHRIINGNVILHLPPIMGKFIQQVAFLTAHASDADNRKGGDGQKPYILKEGPRHFIDIDSYPEFASKSVPTSFSTVIARYDSATVFNYGTNPWASVWTLDSLTAQLHRADWQDVWQSAADLGHYVGDAHQPLHATKDYDGRSSIAGSNGVHSRYETGMINAYQTAIIIRPDSVHFIASPIDFMFGIVYQSNSYVDSIYIADVYARQVSGGQTSQMYYDTLWSRCKGFTQLQFQRATVDYADLLYTAWVNAGSPDLTDVPQFSMSELPQNVWLGQNYPNPFNPSTRIFFQLSKSSDVKLEVFSIQGKRVAVLLDRTMSAGTHESTFDANTLSLSSGVYFYRLNVQSGASSRTFTNKMLLLK
jgi:hypothetical protein